jgi:hypothetical protein
LFSNGVSRRSIPRGISARIECMIVFIAIDYPFLG